MCLELEKGVSAFVILAESVAPESMCNVCSSEC